MGAGWLVWVSGCSGALSIGRGGPVPDQDGDGYAVDAGDCDDLDPAVHPGAVDLPLDGVDADCTGGDAVALPSLALDPGDLVITEVMRDPVGLDPDLGEWFELANQRDAPVDLTGLRVTDEDTDAFTVSTPTVIDAGGILVLGGWDDPADNGGVDVDLRWPAGFGLANGEDRIVLVAGERVIDAVAWDPTWPSRDGYALSRGAVGWCLARDADVYGPGGRGTPGTPNPPCPPPFDGLQVADLQPGDLVIDEVMQNPLAADDDFGEWFEVYVATDAAVDLWHLVVEDDAGDGFEVDGPLVVEPGAYVVFASFADPAVNGGVPATAEWRWDFGLANTGDTIRLLAGTTVVDAIAYDNGASFPDPTGASMALDPAALDAAANDDGANWCVGGAPYGLGDLGSPGAPNPGC